MDGNVLIHCEWGISRSASIIIYHLMHEDLYIHTVDEWINELRKIRPIIHPNRGFLKQLENFQQHVEFSLHVSWFETVRRRENRVLISPCLYFSFEVHEFVEHHCTKKGTNMV